MSLPDFDTGTRRNLRVTAYKTKAFTKVTSLFFCYMTCSPSVELHSFFVILTAWILNARCLFLCMRIKVLSHGKCNEFFFRDHQKVSSSSWKRTGLFCCLLVVYFSGPCHQSYNKPYLMYLMYKNSYLSLKYLKLFRQMPWHPTFREL